MAKRANSTASNTPAGDKVMAEAKKAAAKTGDPWKGIGLAVEAARLDNTAK